MSFVLCSGLGWDGTEQPAADREGLSWLAEGLGAFLAGGLGMRLGCEIVHCG